MKPVDTMIYLKRNLDDSDRLILENSLRKIAGIIAPWFAPDLDQVVVVYYNPEITNTKILLSAIRRLGYEPRLVSL